ncbi:MAG: nebramycin 5' synthase [bacterium]|nr:nebramycin 5' synthase [bacterium]
MRILGISELDNDAGACALVDGRIVAAANEERFSRIKQHAGFPTRAVEWICSELGLKPREFDGVAIAKPPAEEEIRLVRAPLAKYSWNSENHSTALEKWLTRAAFRFHRFPKHARSARALNRELEDWLRRSGMEASRLYRVDHHRAHALSAYYASGFDSALVATCDGQGAGVTGTLRVGEGNELRKLQTVFLPHSMGNFYAAATRALGFLPNRHEGKVTGLAAFGHPSEEDLNVIRRLAWFEGDSYHSPCVHGAYPGLLRFRDQVGKERFAACFQQILEEVVTGWVRSGLRLTGKVRVALAGGVFANVKLNQRIAEIGGVEEVFVFPGMADGGLGHGAALGWDQDLGAREAVHGLEHVFWGPEPREAECEAALASSAWEWSRPNNLEAEIARLLGQGKTVAVCRGRLEFGPRALGHRSILYQATDPTVNDWLNRKLRRTEFMPFAPMTRSEDLETCYQGFTSKSSARFMTITTDCSREMSEKCPAVVHVDGTARPQIVAPEGEPFAHRVLTEYQRLTGLPCLINTSFNLHEEPIVCSVSDAVRAAGEASLDALVLGPYLALLSQRG